MVTQQNDLLQPAIAYGIFKERDRRFDGLVFIGVTSTGIYCRSVCPAPMAKPQNCRFYVSAATAEKAGFRPCLRCRPEQAPGNSSVDAVSTWVYRAICRMEYSLLEDWRLNDLAAYLGISDRHLRRAFVQELGVTPIEYLQSYRLLRAKELLTDTALPVTQVAFASGFRSLRRFNEVFKNQYHLSPTSLRKKQFSGQSQEDTLKLHYYFRPPYDWQHLYHYFSGRTGGLCELGWERRYYRTARIKESIGWFSVGISATKEALEVCVSAGLHPVVGELVARIKHQFDLHANPSRIVAVLEADPILKVSVRQRPGLRSPGTFDGFELLVRTILGQHISIQAANTLMRRLVSTFGEPLETPVPGLTHLSPLPETLAAASHKSIAAIGMPARRAETIRHAARAYEAGQLDLRPGADIDRVAESLLRLPGIGPWTAQYVLMRAVAWPDAFPGNDLGIQKALGTRQKAVIEQRSQAWHPWRSYATHHLWNTLAVNNTV